MKTQSPDTHPDVEKILIDAYRRMTPAEKIAKMRQLNECGSRLAFADVRRRYPDAPEREIWLRVASRYLSADLMQKAFGWNPAEKGY